MEYALGIDIGTTAVKVALVDTTGHFHGCVGLEYELEKSPPCFVEIDPEVYWETTCRAIREVVARSSVGPHEIVAMSVTSQGETMIVVDRDGRPLRRAIVWLDSRTTEESRQLTHDFDIDEVYRTTGQQEIIPAWVACRILWLKKHEPDCFKAAHKYLLVGDYILYKLTGRYVSDCGLALTTLCCDIVTRTWWPKMLDYLGVSEDRMPQLVSSVNSLGGLTPEAADRTGLPPAISVSSCPIDQVTGAVGVGNISPGMVSETTGAAQAVAATFDYPAYDPKRRVGLYLHAIPGLYVLLPWAPTAGMALRWLRDEFFPEHDYSAMTEEAAGVPCGSEGMVVLPYFCGALNPYPDPHAKAHFFNVTLGHKRAHFVRATIESIAMILKGNLQLVESLGARASDVRSLGGTTRSDLLMRIKADACQRTIQTMECEESTSLGAAMLAFIAVGRFDDLTQAATEMVRVKRCYHPTSDHASVYERLLEKHLEQFTLMKNQNRN